MLVLSGAGGLRSLVMRLLKPVLRGGALVCVSAHWQHLTALSIQCGLVTLLPQVWCWSVPSAVSALVILHMVFINYHHLQNEMILLVTHCSFPWHQLVK
jgi:hypothetical protein